MYLSAPYKSMHNFSFKRNQTEKKKKLKIVICCDEKKLSENSHIITSQPFSAPISGVFSTILYQQIAEVT